MRIDGDRIIKVEPIGPSDDYDPVAYQRFIEAMTEASWSFVMFGDALLEFSRSLNTPDETGGMTLDELLPEIDNFLAEYRSEA